MCRREDPHPGPRSQAAETRPTFSTRGWWGAEVGSAHAKVRATVRVLDELFDSVLMLTISNWFTEMRSNRYNFAIRFARHLPVYFVQTDELEARYRFEKTELDNVTVIHLHFAQGALQTRLLKEALQSVGILHPLLWIYNFHMLDFVQSYDAKVKVHHATEDWFSPEAFAQDGEGALRAMLPEFDLVIAVSAGILERYRSSGGYQGRALVATNGCDFKFWSQEPNPAPEFQEQPIALYQGGIFRKIDFELLEAVVRRLPDWQFWFCGAVFECIEEWERLLTHPNVRYLGRLPVEEVRRLAYGSTVGLIPFKQNDWSRERAFPLKTFEYLASGLPAISVPIRSLEEHDDVISFGRTAEDFVEKIREAGSTRRDPEAVARRRKAAAGQDYDDKFLRVVSEVESLVAGSDL